MTKEQIFFKHEVEGRKFQFITIEEMQEYLANLKNEWQWVPEVSGIISRISNDLSSPSVNSAKIKKLFEALIQTIPYKDEALHQFFLDMKAKKRPGDSLLAAYSVLKSNKVSNVINIAMVNGIIDAYFFQKGVNLTDIETNANDSIRQKATNLLAEVQEDIARSRLEMESFKNSTSTLIEENEKNLKDICIRIETNVNTKLQEINDLLEKTSKDYQEQLSLRAPVTYWRNKMRNHWIAVAVLSFVCFVVSISGGFWIFTKLNSIKESQSHVYTTAEVESESRNVLQELRESFVGKLRSADFIGVIFVLFLVIWLLRVLVRNLMANIHMAGDASERVVMITTYLALNQEKNINAKEQIMLILSAIFRPSVQGVINDDGMPNHWKDMANSGK